MSPAAGPQRPGLFARIGRALQGIGRIARFALGSGQHGADVTQDFLITQAEARQGARKHLRYSRGTDLEEVIVTIPPGIRPPKVASPLPAFTRSASA